MILALDVGNSQIYGGIFGKDSEKSGENLKMLLSFRRNSKQGSSSDEIGIFLRTVLRENHIDPTLVTQIALCSVVPDVIYSLRGACKKYFNINPFVLQAGVKTGLKIKYRNPVEVGSDRIANSIAAVQMFPGEDLVIVDLGTATTFCAVSREKDYLGGSIVAGLRLCMEALEAKTAKLPAVEIMALSETCGKTTIESIQSGLYFGHIGMIKEISSRLQRECFPGGNAKILGTGGFAHLFDKEKIFDAVVPDLVLKGLLASLKLNS